MGKALYRKYRSKTLDEIVGQSHITDILKRAIANGHVAHAYLLTGPRGVGKTSIARILAHEINHLPYSDESSHLDIIEIDAASNNSVEDIRTLREKAQIAPAQAEKKIYIIDEVHMLSKSAFNALLKTLEEPPEHVVFILATTDVEKLPATIISRVQRFNFRAISPEDAIKHLRHIADTEHIAIDDGALGIIALHGKGSFRDSIGLLDQLQNISDETITAELVQQVLGLAEGETIEKLLAAYETGDVATIVSAIDTAEQRGTPATVLAEQLIRSIRPRVAEKPQLLPLLDRLLDISKSAWPHIKLLTALTIDRAAVLPAPTSAKAAPTPTSESPAPTPPKRPDEKTPEKTVVKKADQAKPAAKESVPTAKNETKQPAPSADQPFPWNDFLAHVKEQSDGCYALLTKADFTFDGQQLHIYAGRKFNKNKLDKSLSELNAAMQAIGVEDGTIEISEHSLPPKDSKTAAIFDIMGGGQEVSL